MQTEFRVVQIQMEPPQYIIQRKGWFFWRSAVTEIRGHETVDTVFHTSSDAVEVAKAMLDHESEEWRNRKFQHRIVWESDHKQIGL